MLIDWINDVLVGERIIVKDLAEDLYDGQVLQKLFGERTDSSPPRLCEVGSTSYGKRPQAALAPPGGSRYWRGDAGEDVATFPQS